MSYDRAHELYSKMDAQTRADVDELVMLTRSNPADAKARFDLLAKHRNWPLWIAAAIAEIVKALKDATP